MDENTIATAILNRATWYRTKMTIPDFLHWIANYYSEKEIKALLANGVECGFDKFCQRMAREDIMAILDLE